MNVKQKILNLFICAATFFHTAHLFPGQPFNAPFSPAGAGPGAPFNPAMNEEEMLSKLMEEINAAIPEDQRDAFWKEVEAETKRLEEATANMSEDEKLAYLNNRMTEAFEEAAQATQPEAEKPVAQEKVEEKPKPKPAPVKEAIETNEVIQSIVKSINAFITKANAFPDFDRKTDKWAKDNFLSDWPVGQTWELFKNELNKFNSLIQRFQEKDAKIGMKHIDKLAKNEAALQALKQLETKLAREIPNIDVSVFSITSMSKQTKNAIAHTMNALTESLYKIKLNEMLQKIIEEFDPEAKKLREAEEKAAKDALTKAQRPTSNVPVKTAGKAEQKKGDFTLPSFDEGSYGGYGSYPSGGSYGSGSGYDNYSDGFGGDASKGGSSTGGKAGGAASGSGSKAGDIKGKGEEKAGAGAKDKVETVTSIKNTDVKEHFDNFKREYGEANKILLQVKDIL